MSAASVAPFRLQSSAVPSDTCSASRRPSLSASQGRGQMRSVVLLADTAIERSVPNAEVAFEVPASHVHRSSTPCVPRNRTRSARATSPTGVIKVA